MGGTNVVGTEYYLRDRETFIVNDKDLVGLGHDIIRPTYPTSAVG